MTLQNRKYGVFILSHGRPDKQRTYKALRKVGYTGPIRIVCDDEDKTIDDYLRNFKDEVLIFNKQSAIEKTETFYNQPYHKAVIYARGTLYDFSKQLGWTHFIMMDDDYDNIYYRWNQFCENVGKSRFLSTAVKEADALFDATFDLLETTGADTISFSQGGDLIGGTTGNGGEYYFIRKVMNTHFVDVSRPLTFRGFVNEDVNLYVERPFNRLMFQTCRVSVTQPTTQSASGGATDMYLQFGTYVKSFMSVICAPSCVKIRMLRSRIHHAVSRENCYPKILPGKFKKD